MPNTKKYKERVCFSFNTDRELLTKAQEACKKQGLTASEYLTNLMREDMQKNEIGQMNRNPIAITYGDHSTAKRSDCNNTLDYFLEKGFVTKDYFKPQLKGKPIEHLQKVSALGRTINQVAEVEIGYAKTGRYTAIR